MLDDTLTDLRQTIAALESEAYGEERWNLLGMCEGVILHVTYTERGERIRIISARRAERHEQDRYYRQNAP